MAMALTTDALTSSTATESELAVQSPQFLPNASDFHIVGGAFVLGDVHNHSALDSVRDLPALPPANPLDEAYSESEIYHGQLLRQKRGIPLHRPAPQRNLPEEYQRKGVAIGDVGRITPDGEFDFFFNIYLPADHPVNDNDVPDDFAPLEKYLRRDLFHTDFEPGDYVSSPSVQKVDLESSSDEFPGAGFLFNCEAPQGAILALPHGARLEKLANLESMKQHVAKNAESWYTYINDVRGRGLANGDLYLVTGCEKSSSWGMASYQSIREEFQLTFKPTADADAAYKYRWKGIHGRKNPARTKTSKPALMINQTTFVHGFSISLGGGIWSRVFGDVGICENVDLPLDASRGGDPGSRSHDGGSSFFSWSFGFLGGATAGGKHRAAGDADIFISEQSPTSKIFHPSQIINRFLLHKVPHARVAMSHDDDWRDILHDNGTQSSVQNASQFVQIINDQFDVVEQDGAIFLANNSDSHTMDGALASSSSSSTNAYDSSPATNSHIGRHHIQRTDSSSRRSQSPSAASADSFEDWMNDHTTPLTPPSEDRGSDSRTNSSTRTRGAGSKSMARTSGAPKPRGATRAKSGCYTCRIRRKKCDERPNLDGACETCVRLRIQCLGFGAQRPEWLREKRQVSETRDKIKGFLGAQGRIRGRPGPAAGSGSRDSDQTLPVLQLDTEDHSSAVRETSRLTLPTPDITPVITEGYDLPAVEYSPFFTRHTEYSAPPPTEYPY